jgi:hypothetical protein
MQSAVTAEKQNDVGNLVTAEVLREMTITKEDLLKRQKESVLEALMSSMVRLASEQGSTSYSANLHPQFDSVILVQIVDTLKSLGYTVVTEKAKEENTDQEIIRLVVTW